MKIKIKAFLTPLLAVCLAVILSAGVFAATSSVIYAGQADKFVFAPENGDLFQSFKGVMPGDTLTQQIRVENKASNNVKVKIFLRAEAVDEVYRDFLGKLTLTVAEGDTDIFSAPASEASGLVNDTLLCTLYSGGKTELDVTLKMPETLSDAFQNAEGKISWVFTVEELPIEDSDPTPKTGDSMMLYVAFIATSVCCMGTAAAVISKKRRSER